MYLHDQAVLFVQASEREEQKAEQLIPFRVGQRTAAGKQFARLFLRRISLREVPESVVGYLAPVRNEIAYALFRGFEKIGKGGNFEAGRFFQPFQIIVAEG